MRAGERILHYRLERELGRGGMGTVWLAQDTKLGRQVALKFLHGWAGLDGDAAARLEREARAASSMDHPGVVTVHSIEAGPDGPFVVMEFVRGERIDSYVEARPRDPRRVLELAADAAEAVAAAHAEGVVHRDLKASNLYVDERGCVRVLDFGLAQVRDAPRLTKVGATLGTVGYSAPEQLRGEDVGPAADVFSLGVVLHELLTGERLFDRGQGTPAVMLEVLQVEATRPSKSVAGLPPGTDDLLARALAKDPARRPADCGVLAHELRALTSSAESAEIESMVERRALLRLRPWVGALALLALVGYSVVLWKGGARPLDEARGPYADWIQRSAGIFAKDQRDPDFSPDGRRLAFVGSVDGAPQLQVTLLDDPSPLVLTRESRAVSTPRWSPDGESILYHVEGPPERPLDTSVHVIGVLGGRARQVVEVGRNARWHPSGGRVVFERGGTVLTVDVDESGAFGAPAEVVGVPVEVGVLYDRMPCFSPSGDQLVFATSELGPLSTLWELELESGGLRQLMGERARIQDPVYSADGVRILFTANLAEAMTIWSIDRATGERQAVTAGVGTDLRVDPSPDGARLAYVNLREEFSLGLYDTATGEQTVLQRSRAPMLGPRFTPDGTRIAFFGGGAPGTDVFTVDLEGGAPQAVLRSPNQLEIFPLVDPTGRFVYCFTEGVEVSRFVRLALDDGSVEPVFEGWSMQDISYPDISPSGEELVAFDVGAQRTTIYPLDGSEPRSLDAGIFRARWSPDGSRLVGVRGKGELVEVDLTTQQERVLGQGDGPVFGPDGEIWFTRLEGESRHLFSVDPRTRVERLLTSFGLPWYEVVDGFDLTAAGRVVWSEYAELGTEIILLERPLDPASGD